MSASTSMPFSAPTEQSFAAKGDLLQLVTGGSSNSAVVSQLLKSQKVSLSGGSSAREGSPTGREGC